MSEYEHGGKELANINKRNNDTKYFCHFTGFLDGVAASGQVEIGEIEPLISECRNFVSIVADIDAFDLLQDFEADLLAHETIADAAEYRRLDMDPNCEKSLVNWFLGYCRGIACDATITKAEAQGMLAILEQNPRLLEVVGVKQIQITCIDAIEDGILSHGESQEICDAIGFVVGDCYADTGLAQTDGVANYSEFQITDLESEIIGKNLVFTGNFKVKPRSTLERSLEDLGAIVSRSVSSKTDFLVVGGEASRDWIEMNRGTKIRAAQKLRLLSDRPFFVSESQLLRLMQNRH